MLLRVCKRCKCFRNERSAAHGPPRSDRASASTIRTPSTCTDLCAIDSVGRIATILFAYRFGPALEAECKKYRFLADIFNDSAMLMDCLSPAFPRTARLALLCLSGSLRALCGVAAGASKTSLSVHFAKNGNVGELNAKVRQAASSDIGKRMR